MPAAIQIQCVALTYRNVLSAARTLSAQQPRRGALKTSVGKIVRQQQIASKVSSVIQAHAFLVVRYAQTVVNHFQCATVNVTPVSNA